MKLKEAYLCVQCEEIFKPYRSVWLYGQNWAICPVCANKFTLSLGRILNENYSYQEEEKVT